MALSKKLENAQMEQLKSAIQLRSQAKMMEDEAKTLKEEANQAIITTTSLLGIKEFLMEGVGKVTVKNGKNVSISQDKLRESLLRNGVGYDTANKIIDESTKTTEYTSVEFRLK